MTQITIAEDHIDRIAPTRCPKGFSVMRQRWRHLLFLHWAVPAEILRLLLPPGLELDTFEGNAYVGLVPFTMTGVRPTLLPAFPPLSNFHEVNVRTYVHHNGEGPGVWFFSLDAASAFAVRLARSWFKLPYYFAYMNLEKQEEQIEYTSVRGTSEMTPPGCRILYTPHGEPAIAVPGSLEHFLVERYLLYSYANGHLFRGQVHHTPYPLQSAKVETLEEDLISAAGIARPDTEPLIHYAREVRVRIFSLQRIV